MRNTLGVVITARNCAGFLKETLSAIYSQSVPFNEVAVVDDASTDETPFILERLKGKYPTLKVVRNKTNLERCISRNRGAEILNTEYVCFCDCDDLYTPHYAERVLEVIREENPDAVYQFPKGFVNERGEVVRKKKPPSAGFEELLFSGNIGYPTGSCFKRETFLKLGGYKNEFLHREDWEIFLRFFSERAKISFLPSGEYFIREHGGRSSRKNPLFLEATVKVFEEYFPKTPEGFRGLMLHHLTVQCFRFKRRRCGFKYLLRLAGNYPQTLRNKKRFWELAKRVLKV